MTAAYGEKELYFPRFHSIHSYPEIRPKERALKLSYKVNKRLFIMTQYIYLFYRFILFTAIVNMCKVGATEFSPKYQIYNPHVHII